MTRLEELIERLCPDGVEYKRICDISSNISSGGTPKSENAEYYNGNIPWLRTQEVNFNEVSETGVKITSEGLKNSSAKWIPANCVIVAMYGATVGRVAINKVPLTTNQACCNIEVNSQIALYKYVFYSLWNQYEFIKSLGQGSQTNINSKIIRNLKIPVPPLEVQQEIVRILDQFTQLTEELNERLDAERTARKQQYKYYLNQLLEFEDESIWVELGTVIKSVNTGLNPRRFFKLNTNDASNYYVTIRELQNNSVVFSKRTDRINDEALRLCNKRSNLEIGDILFSGTGTIGETAVVEKTPTNWNIKEGVYSIKPLPEKLNSRFLMYVLHTNKIKTEIFKKVAGGTVKSIPMGELRKLKIPVPPMSEQERLVNLIDRFDALCNDLTSGLTAEIAARQKQYEYYRDKLLTFKEREA